tara:strand:+ start:741 stop:1406 length:666 start_codon:yes stop_codon:yes gene_type:complete
MKKLVLSIFAAAAMMSSALAAELHLGVSAQMVKIEADGTETEGGENNTGSVSHTVPVGSIFAEITSGRFTLGLDYIPMDAEVSDATKKRTDTETSVTGTAAETTTSRTQTAQAELSNHMMLYTELMVTDNFYAKAGFVSVDVATQESLGTGSKYPDDTINGILVGAGLKRERGNGYFKIEATYTDYEDIALQSTVARTGVATNNKITADIDAAAIKLSYAF